MPLIENGASFIVGFPIFVPHRVSCCFLLPFLLFVVFLLMVRLTYAVCGIFGHFETLSACQQFLPRSMQSPNVIYCVILVYPSKWRVRRLPSPSLVHPLLPFFVLYLSIRLSCPIPVSRLSASYLQIPMPSSGDSVHLVAGCLLTAIGSAVNKK